MATLVQVTIELGRVELHVAAHDNVALLVHLNLGLGVVCVPGLGGGTMGDRGGYLLFEVPQIRLLVIGVLPWPHAIVDSL